MEQLNLQKQLLNIDNWIETQKRVDRKNKILAQTQKFKQQQGQKNQTKIQGENQTKKIVNKSIKFQTSIKENIKQYNFHNFSTKKVIQKKEKSKTQLLLEDIHLKILPFTKISEQILNYFNYKNNLTQQYANQLELKCCYSSISAKKNQKKNDEIKTCSLKSINSKIIEEGKQQVKTKLETFSFNQQFKDVILYKEDIQKNVIYINDIQLLMKEKKN